MLEYVTGVRNLLHIPTEGPTEFPLFRGWMEATRNFSNIKHGKPESAAYDTLFDSVTSADVSNLWFISVKILL